MKVFLGIILIIGFIKQVYLQCENSCHLDEECLPFIINGTTHYSCECNATIYNNDPDFPLLLSNVPVYCSPNQLAIKLTSCLGQRMLDFNILLPDENIVDNQCFSHSEAVNFDFTEFQFNFSSTATNCQAAISMNSTHVTYSVPVWFKYNTTNQIVIIYNDILVTYNCSYPLTMNASLNIGLNPYLSPDHLSIARFGTHVLTMQLFKYSNYTGSYTIADLPIYIKVGTPLYIGASIMGPDPQRFSMKIDSCYATPTSNPSDPIKYNFISDSCPLPGFITISFIQDGVDLMVYFSMKAFRMARYSQVYLHCSFSLCAGKCPPSCSGTQ
ncbi:uromodulin-like [Protopterus annectens]|uniref:uromodulin-like n=1 Tax=Protopterus annectens TaxID=7888 RepID=UPI001CF97016|nr:uromodulin-like [Protopterus annectens]